MRLIDADAFKKWLLENSINEREEKESRQIGIWIDAFPSAQPEPHWIPFHKRALTEEEQKEHKDWCWILDCELPDDNQEVLISSPYFGVYIDTFYNDGECSFDGGEEINDGMAWKPLPEPYQPKEGKE